MILHIDMDAFFASVEERENPEFAGKPLVVGGQPSCRGVVAAANYAARRFGISSAMPTSAAVRKCPGLLIIKPRGKLYGRVSGQIREIFHRYTPVIEPLSLDEAFLDPKGSEKLHGDAVAIGKKIKSDIKTELNLIASVGVAPNKFLAKLASDHGKPDGFTVIAPENIQPFLDPLPVDKIWGVGKAVRGKLTRLNVRTIYDLRRQHRERLMEQFGKYGDRLWNLAHGIDRRKVTPDSEVKSISRETTFDVDVTDYDSIVSTAFYLTEGVGYRLRESGLKGKTVTVKIRCDDFKTITRSKSLESPTFTTSRIWRAVKLLIEKELKSRPISIRLIGVGISNFNENQIAQTSIFENNRGNRDNSDLSHALDSLSDEIKRRYGKEMIKRGKSLSHK